MNSHRRRKSSSSSTSSSSSSSSTRADDVVCITDEQQQHDVDIHTDRSDRLVVPVDRDLVTQSRRHEYRLAMKSELCFYPDQDVAQILKPPPSGCSPPASNTDQHRREHAWMNRQERRGSQEAPLTLRPQRPPRFTSSTPLPSIATPTRVESRIKAGLSQPDPRRPVALPARSASECVEPNTNSLAGAACLSDPRCPRDNPGPHGPRLTSASVAQTFLSVAPCSCLWPHVPLASRQGKRATVEPGLAASRPARPPTHTRHG